LCQRYYEIGAGLVQATGQTGSVATTVVFKATKRGLPTVTRTGEVWTGGETGTLVFVVLPEWFIFYKASSAQAAGGYFTASAEL
jgi:hypothetical protein